MKRKINISYMDGQKKYFSGAKGHFENLLNGIGDIDLKSITSLEDPDLQEADLVLTTADHVDNEDFPNWLAGLSRRFQKNNLIWVPALILAEISHNTQKKLLLSCIRSNWYFDIVSPNNLDSLPLRMANLIRIHDHLRELNRYDQELNQLSNRLKILENQVPETLK